MKKLLLAAGTAALLSGCQTIPSVSDSVNSGLEAIQSGTESMQVFGSARVLDDVEVRKLFVGNTVESHNRSTQLNSITYYHPNGQAIQQRLWSKRLGKWAIQDAGQICLAFGDRPMKCRHIVKDGDRYYKVRADSDGKMEKIVRYRYFAPGNLVKDGG